MRASATRLFLALLASLVVPAAAHAQATMAGTVSDASGAVLPGVTVEASSATLIEKTRTAVTDGSGQYRLVNLPPGTYALTLSLPGFVTVRREELQLTAAAVTTINVEMRLGSVEETVTVTGATPIVDVQSANRGVTLTSDVVNQLPSTRGYNALVQLIPSITSSTSNQVQITPTVQFFASHGGRSNEGRVLLDGLQVGAAVNGAGTGLYMPDTAGAQEVTVSLSGGLGEAEAGGAVMNIIPKTGGNTFSGIAFASSAAGWSQGSNLDDRLRGFGLTDPPKIINNWDYSASLGGPLKRDRIWFYATYRDFGQHQDIPGMYANKNAGDASKWNYEPDRNVKARNATARTITSARVTGQITPRNKVSAFYDHQFWCDGSAMTRDAGSCRNAGSDWIANGTPTVSPEAASGPNGPASGYADTNLRLVQASWTSTVTSALLLEGGLSSGLNRGGIMAPPGLVQLIPVTEQASLNGMPAGLTYRGLARWQENWQNPNSWRAALSFVTGAHHIKVGYQGAYYVFENQELRNEDRLTYQFNNGVPNRLTMDIGNWTTSDRAAYHALYAQEQWRYGRLTVQSALRFDHAYSYAPADDNGWNAPDRFHATALTFPRTDSVTGFNDVTPRVGAALDVFGTGTTSLKINVGKYLESASLWDRYTINNPAQTTRFQRTTARNWNDANLDVSPDCDLMNPSANGECGPWLSPTFGSPLRGATINTDILRGWGVRPSDWQFGASIQRELLPRMSVEVGYNRRWFQNFIVTDNLAVDSSSFDAFTIVAPAHASLPQGGGFAMTYLDPRTLATDNYVTFETDYGEARAQYWHGVDVNLSARWANGLVVQGGTTTGRSVQDFCDVAGRLPETFVGATRQPTATCETTDAWQTQFKGVASYTVPKIEVQVSTAVQLKPGSRLAANYAVPNAQVAGSLGRLPTGGLINGNTVVNLLVPGELYGERINQVDVRMAKVLRIGGSRADVGFDVYNVLNANPGLTYNQTFTGTGATWLRPTTILFPRFLRFNATLYF
jgi:hypothetical protein